MGNRSHILQNHVRWEIHDRMVFQLARDQHHLGQAALLRVTKHYLMRFDTYRRQYLLSPDPKEFVVEREAEFIARRAWNDTAELFAEIDFW